MSADVPHHAELTSVPVDGGNDVSHRDVLILYATETGTAQDVADRIARECRRGHFRCRVRNIGSYPPVSDPLTCLWIISILFSLGRAYLGASRDICCRDHRVGRGAARHDASVEITSPIRSTQ